MKSLRGMVMVHNEAGKRVYEHRHVYERFNNIKLTKNDIIHHVDGNKSNNDPENLIKCTRQSHLWMHQAMAYWYQVEVMRNAGIKTKKEFIHYILKKAFDNIEGMAENVGRSNGNIVPIDLIKTAKDMGCTNYFEGIHGA